jgi:hypothetical protein
MQTETSTPTPAEAFRRVERSARAIGAFDVAVMAQQLADRADQVGILDLHCVAIVHHSFAADHWIGASH